MREQIITDKCTPCHGPYAQGVKMGNLIFTTQVGLDVEGNIVEGGMKEQTKATMENAKAVLEAAGATMEDIGKITILVSDMDLVPEMNEVYKTYFEEGNYPARCCTQCGKLSEGFLVEMEFTAVLL